MSKCQTVTLGCPACSNSQEISLWDSVNVTVDPELKEEVLAQNINTFNCNYCGGIYNVQKDLLYHDMDNNILIYLIHEDDASEAEEEVQTFSAMFGYKKKRLVRDMNQLRKKTLFLKAG